MTQGFVRGQLTHIRAQGSFLITVPVPVVAHRADGELADDRVAGGKCREEPHYRGRVGPDPDVLEASPRIRIVVFLLMSLGLEWD
jgi:hypothetical protein